ncbi:MAG: RDD family protein [Bacilli bacterium]|nr:RDD family protein [Bacilli bacterium]
MFKKRLLAYILDILILNMILSIVTMIIPIGDNLVNLNNEFLKINNEYLNSSIDFSTYINRYFDIMYNVDKELFLTNLINIIGSIIYFVVYPLYNNGQSIGKKLLKLRIVNKNNDDVSANSLIARYMFMNNIGVSIISLCLLLILNNKYYFISTSILDFLQFLLVIISIFMVLYRRDKRSLTDLIAGTKVIEVEK